MPRVLVCYGTTEGQTAKVAARIADRLRGRGHHVDVRNAADAPRDLAGFDGVVVGASVHGGRHQRTVERFVRAHVETLNALPSAFLSVSLSAASTSPETRAEADAVLRGFLDRVGWQPDATATVAGALAYSQYGRLKRYAMKRITAKEYGNVDASRDREYTDWAAVDAFADEFGQVVERGKVRV